MQPYQQASDEVLRQSRAPGEALKQGVKIAGGLIGGGAIFNRVKPLLNKLISPALASKGLSKIDPRYGKFINGMLDNGSTQEGAIDFIKGKVDSEEPAKDNRNVIQQYSDQLFAFLKNHIDQGRSPLEAGALAQLDAKFKKPISQMEKDHKTNWSSILQSVFGGQQQTSKAALQGQPQQMQGQQSGGAKDQLLQAMQQLSQTLKG